MTYRRVRWTTLALLLIAGALAAPAQGASPSFSSSFEPTDPQPTWTDTAERAQGVTGPDRPGIPGNVTDTVVAMKARGENANSGEVKENLVDGSPDSKWLDFNPTSWVELELAEPVTIVRYALTSANDAPSRDPRDWTLKGSTDGQTWTTLDTRSGESFSDRFQTKTYDFANSTAYKFFRLDITANSGATIFQLAELQLSTGQENPPPPPEMRSQVGSGPRGGYNAKAGAGWTGLRALRYAGKHTAKNRAYSYNKVFDVDVPVTSSTQLSYMIYPDFERDDLDYPSTYAAVDLHFTDGTYLSDLHAVDQHGAELSPRAQGAAKTLYTNQWNAKRSRIGSVAAGKTIDRILVAYDNPRGTHAFGGWIDDIDIGPAGPGPSPARLSNWVITTRGTNSSGGFSRGNNIPATAVPHGFNFWTPVTNANTLSWLYEYQRDNNADNLPVLEAFAASHEPSPWMGDRQTFQVMPSVDTGTPQPRPLAFRHSNEVTSPHHYAVTFENDLETEIAPTDHAALFRFTFPGDSSSLVFRNVEREEPYAYTVDQAAGVVTGWTDIRSGLSNGATRMYMYATFDKPITASGAVGDGPNRFARFDARTVNMRIATSLISIDQAKDNLELELEPSDTVETVKARAQGLWDAKLKAIEVQGATDDQLTTLYSNLYRLSLYPNSAFENTGTKSAPHWQHAVQSSTGTVPSSPTQTGAPVVDGKVYVNNGFWDTYRTVWSGYSLFDSGNAGELIDGFVQQYRDGGWIARWSSPGYANLMTGTSSDVSFADAYVKGIGGFDATDAYDAALKNATVAPPGSRDNSNVGRKGLWQSLFFGYTPSRVSEGVSWALEGDINDYGISNMAGKLASASSDPKLKRRYEEEREYFRSRATDYVHMFDPAVGFFQGRDANGRWKSAPEDYDPRVWGHEHDYTETNGWGFAFHAPQDGQGLANLYGGRAGLAKKLDEFFSTPETGKFVGSYGGTIHEMIEARDVRMGQWGFSNQVSHHIPYMYDYTGQPYKTAEKVRETLRRLYVGSEIGQGYGGDEDNGETSAWYLFSALGFYPLQVGSENYAIGSPLFKQATVHLAGGKDLVVRAPKNSDKNIYVQRVTLNGKAIDRAWLSHSQIAGGGTLEFDMGPQPSKWATGADAAPPSITQGSKVAEPLQDQTRDAVASSAAGDAAKLSDDDSSSTASPGAWVQYRFQSARPVRFYTLTSGTADGGGEGGDPGHWVVKGSDDGTSWTTLDERSGEQFRWRSQTRPFKLANSGSYAYYRIEFSGGEPTLGEVELLNPAPPETAPVTTKVDPVVMSAGDSATLSVKVTNHGSSPASGMLAATAPAGLTVTPTSASFGPLDPGASTEVPLKVDVADGVAPGSYSVKLALTSNLGNARDTATVAVIADTVVFSPGTDAETPWLIDADGSQLDGPAYDGRGRFCDGTTHATYKFQLPSDVTGGTLTLELANEFLVEASTDGSTWKEVLRQPTQEHDQNNRGERTLQLNDLRGDGHTVYVRLGDSFPTDGWGGWLARVKLVMERG
jgi:predicted alpha-1,2-mannosidase